MRVSTLAAGVAAGAAAVSAQDMPMMSICDKYTTALLKNNTAANQYTLLTLLVNTVGIGNFTGPGTTNPTLPGSMVNVPGILAPGVYNGEAVNLLPYFDGTLASSNRGGKAVAINFLDGGGAAPIIANPLSSGMAGSKQEILFQHLYQYFGALLGCSGYGTAGFPAYMGVQSQQAVHAFMDLDTAQNSWFIQNVGLAALSFGVSQEDVATVGMTLNNTFGYKCAPAVTVIPSAGPVYESICQNVTCPIAPNSTCGDGPAPSYPALAAGAMGMSSSSAAAASGTPSSSMGAASMTSASMMGGASMTSASMMGASATSSMMAGASTTGVAPYTGGAAGVAASGLLAGIAGLFAYML